MKQQKNLDNKKKHLTNLETNEESNKYISEMHKMDELYEKRSTIAFAVIAIPIIILAIVTIKQMISFSINMGSKNDTKIEQIASEDGKKGSTKSDKKPAVTVDPLSDKVYAYLNNEKNRDTVFNKAKALNSNSSKGMTSIFISEILRQNGESIPKSVINAKQLVSELEKRGWKKITDYKQLKKGDVAFGKPHEANDPPSNVFIFMGWVKEGKTDYAYVCDSLVSVYDAVLHKRNIDEPTPKEEAFGFLMRKEN